MGGDWQGAGDMHQATTVVMESGATIDASATESGDGGKVVLWSDIFNEDSLTQIAGTIIAKAGEWFGNGGSIETSGHDLKIKDTASVNAGQGGQWLLDPYNIEIAASGGDVTGATIEASLNAGTSVTLDTSDQDDGEAGDIFIRDQIDATGTGSLTLRADRDIVVGDSLVRVTGDGANINLFAKGDITEELSSEAIHFETGTGDILFSSDTDGTSGGHIEFVTSGGTSLITAGGDVTLAGGDELGTGYALGSANQVAEGILFDGGLSVQSNGGDIVMRGKSFAGTVGSGHGAWGVGSYSGVTDINSGTGKILIDGVSQSSGSGSLNQGVVFNGASATIQSANTSNDAIQILADASAAGAGNSFGLELRASTNKIYATGAGGGILINAQQGSGNNAAHHYRNSVEILANGGDIQLLNPKAGGQMYLDPTASLWLGSKAGTPITTSSSDITIQADTYDFNGRTPDISTTGEFTWLSTADSFGVDVYTDWFTWNAQVGQTIGGLTIGKQTNTSGVNLNIGDRDSTSNPLTVDGGVTAYGGTIDVVDDLTSIGTGDIFLQAASIGNPSIDIAADINKTGGDNSTFTAKGASRIQLHASGSITATNPGGMNVVLWSDYDGGDQGGVSINSEINTGGGHLWAGGSDTTAGSATWNGLTVGNGPSVGQDGYNNNALDFYGNITTDGGDVFLWAGDGYNAGTNGIHLDSARSLDAGTGNVTFIADDITGGPVTLDSTGHFTFAPNSNAWDSSVIGGQLDFQGSISSDTFTGSGDVPWLEINNYSTLGGLTLGKDGSTSSIYVYNPLNIAGPVNLFGARITVAADINTTGGGTAGDVLLKGRSNLILSNDHSITTSGGDITLWSDSENNGQGYIEIGQNATLDSRTDADRLAVTHTTGGGNITLGGGADDGNGAPAGFATSTSSNVDLSGVRLGNNNSATNNTQIYSGGGDILIKGRATKDAWGVQWNDGGTIDAGTTGLINIVGESLDVGRGIEIGAYSQGSTPIIRSGGGSASEAAITINGTTAATDGTQGLMLRGATVESTGDGGIDLAGTTGSSSGHGIDLRSNASVLSASGSINFDGGVYGVKLADATIGRKAGSSVTASTADVTIGGDLLAVTATDIETSGIVTVEPSSTSFSSALTWPISNLNLSSDISGLTLGKEGNTAGITIASNQTVAGAVTVYGGNIIVSGSINTTGGGADGDVLFKASDNVNLDTTRTITTDGGDVTFWANRDDSGGSINLALNSSIVTGGGNITLGGGADTDDDGLPNGAATGFAGGVTDFKAGAMINTVTLDARAGATVDASAGDITINGTGTHAGSENAVGVLLYSTKLFGDVIDITGSVTDTGGTIRRFGIAANGLASPNNTTIESFGGISLTGTAADPATQYSVRWGANQEMSVIDGDIEINSTGQLLYLSGQTLVLPDEHSLILNTDRSATWSNLIAGDGGLIKQGTGTLTLDAANTYTGGTVISGGTLSQARAGTLQSVSTVQIDDGATWDLNNFDVTVASVTGAGDIKLGTGDLSIGGDNTSGEISGIISGTGDLTKQGTGELVLSGENTYSGSTSVTGSLVVRKDTTTLSTSGFTGNGQVTIEPAGTSFSGPLTIDGSDFASTLSGLTIGKADNAANVIVGTATSIAGDIGIFGGDITLNAGLTSTGTNTTTLTASGALTDGASGFVATDELLINGTGSTTLDHASTAFTTLAADTGALSILESNGFTIGTVGSTSGIDSTGLVNLATQTGDLTIAQNVATTDATASAIVLEAGRSTVAGTAAGGNIIVSGSPTISVGTDGFANLYSGSVSGSTGLTDLIGSASGRFRYNSDSSASNFTLALAAGTNAVYRERPSVTIVADDVTSTYGESPTTTASVNGGVNGDTIAQALSTAPTLTIGGATSTSGEHVAGSHTVTASAAVDQLGYNISGYTDGTLTVDQKEVTVAADVANKVYDGNTTGVVDQNTVVVTGIISGDVVTNSGTTGTFDDKNVGTGKTVTLGDTAFAGTDGANYKIGTSTTTADVTQKAVTVSGIAGVDRVYDGTTDATFVHTGTVFTGMVSGDDLTSSGTTGSFADKNVGTDKSITLSGTTYGGTDVGNYSFTDQATATADITAKAITVSGITAGDKVYDGATTAVVDHSGVTFGGIVAGDTLTASATTGAFADKNVGAGKTVTLSGTLYAGSDVGNYTFTDQTSDTADITQKAVTVSGLAVTDLVYDGNTAAAIDHTGATFGGIVDGDVLTAASTTGVFDNRNVGTDKSVTLSGTTYGGADSANYSFSDQTTALGAITPKSLSIANFDTANKIYDATTAATVDRAGNLVGTVGVDNVTFTHTGATFADKNVGVGKTVTLQGITLGGLHAGNYTVVAPTDTAEIVPYTLDVNGVTGANKVYDGTQIAGLSGTAIVTGLGADTVNVTGSPTAVFSDADVGTGKAITVSGYSLGGTDAANYSLTQPSVSADITAAPLTVTVNEDAKFVTHLESSTYAGVSYDGFVLSESASDLTGTLAITRSGAGTDEAAGTYTDALSASGLSSSNYDLTYVDGDFTIVPAEQLLLRFGDSTGTYADTQTFSLLSAQYLDNGNTIQTLGAPTISGSQYTFNDGANGSAVVTIDPSGTTTSTGGFWNIGSYDLSVASSSETHNNFSDTINIVGTHTVNRANLTPTVSGVSKVYDGTTAMSNVNLGLAGLGANDVVSISGTSDFSSANAGTGLNYTLNNLTLSGADANNYVLGGGSSSTGSNGVITPKAVTLTAPTLTKVYDGNTDLSATASVLSGLSSQLGVAGDSVSSATLTYDDKNVGTSKTLTPSAATIADGNGGNNYTITYADNTSSEITRLDSVTWIGGATGDWSDPNNWAGGAIPDLANVADVIIPDGVTPTFDNSIAGPVEIDSLSGGNLQLDSGDLDVAEDFDVDEFTQNGGDLDVEGDFGAEQVTLNAGNLDVAGDLDATEVTQNGGALDVGGDFEVEEVTQTAGTLAVGGDLDVNDFTQSGGGIEVDGDFIVNDTFNQSSGATIDVEGDAAITHTGGDLTVHSLDAGDVDLTSTTGGIVLGDMEVDGDLNADAQDGDITQTPTGTLAVAGDADLTASEDIALDNTGNDFEGTVNAVADNIAIEDSVGDLTLGNISTPGDLDLAATDGSIDQTPTSAVSVGGQTTLVADDAVTLDGSNNQFTGQVDVEANRAELRQAIGDLLLGDVNVTDSLFTDVLNGGVTQAPGTTLDIGGEATFNASGNINLPSPNNSFGGGVIYDALTFNANATTPFAVTPSGNALARSSSNVGGSLVRDAFGRIAPAIDWLAQPDGRNDNWWASATRLLQDDYSRWIDIGAFLKTVDLETFGSEIFIRRKKTDAEQRDVL